MWKIHPVGQSVVMVAGVIILLLMAVGYFFLPPGPSVFVMLLLFMLYLLVRFFFRYPVRRKNPTWNENVVISPADGVVVINEIVDMPQFPEGKARQVAIFMRLWDVHLNYVPVHGKIVQIEHYRGKHFAAFLPKSSLENEHVDYWIETTMGMVLVREIAGLIARRIVPLAKANSMVSPVDELGFIKFGSRVDLFLPASAEIYIKKSQYVQGGMTLIAKLIAN